MEGRRTEEIPPSRCNSQVRAETRTARRVITQLLASHFVRAVAASKSVATARPPPSRVEKRVRERERWEGPLLFLGGGIRGGWVGRLLCTSFWRLLWSLFCCYSPRPPPGESGGGDWCCGDVLVICLDFSLSVPVKLLWFVFCCYWLRHCLQFGSSSDLVEFVMLLNSVAAAH